MGALSVFLGGMVADWIEMGGVGGEGLGDCTTGSVIGKWMLSIKTEKREASRQMGDGKAGEQRKREKKEIGGEGKADPGGQARSKTCASVYIPEWGRPRGCTISNEYY